MFRKISAAAALSLAVGLGATAPAHATTFAVYNPTVGTIPNIRLSGLNLTSNSAVTFDFKAGNALIALGNLAAHLSLTATETGAISFGPIALGTFDGSFAITYTGPAIAATSLHPAVATGETLLDGIFLGAVFTGYGSAGTLADSLLGGGLVDYNDNAFVQFSPPGGDEGLALAMTSLTPPVAVVGGKLTNFVAVSQGIFAGDNLVTTGGGTPEPGTWALMLIGIGGIGYAARRRAKFAIA